MTNAELDLAVAKKEGHDNAEIRDGVCTYEGVCHNAGNTFTMRFKYHPTTNKEQMVDLMIKYGLSIKCLACADGTFSWNISIDDTLGSFWYDTPMIAVARAVVSMGENDG